MFNYTSNVKNLCDKWTAQDKEFSAWDVTHELRKINSKSAIQMTIHHSLVRSEVHNYMSSLGSYDKRNSDNGAYTVYFPKTVTKTLLPNLSPTFGSFPMVTPTQPKITTKPALQSVKLTKGQNGKFTIPSSLVLPAKKTSLSSVIIKFMTNGKVTHKKTYEVDKSNNVRFRYPVDSVTVQQTSNPQILIARV